MLMAIPVDSLELQARFARGISERHHAPMVDVAIAVEDDLVDALRLELLGDGGPDLLGALALLETGELRNNRLVQRRRGRDRLVRVVVDDLRVDMLGRAEDAQARPLGRARHLLADAVLPTLALLLLSLGHD